MKKSDEFECDNANDEEKLTWRGLWITLKIGFFLGIGYNIGDLLWKIVSRIAAMI